jgi:hypothetical protein
MRTTLPQSELADPTSDERPYVQIAEPSPGVSGGVDGPAAIPAGINPSIQQPDDHATRSSPRIGCSRRVTACIDVASFGTRPRRSLIR